MVKKNFIIVQQQEFASEFFIQSFDVALNRPWIVANCKMSD